LLPLPVKAKGRIGNDITKEVVGETYTKIVYARAESKSTLGCPFVLFAGTKKLARHSEFLDAGSQEIGDGNSLRS
jgi:hypothetical protein